MSVRRNAAAIAALVCACVIALLGVIGYILTSAVKFLTAAVICGLLGFAGNLADGRRAKKTGASRILVMLIFLLILFSMPPLSIRTSATWQYPFARRYIGCYQNVQVPDWFPDVRDDIEREYEFDYSASIMQGTGWCSIRFVTSGARAAEYAAEYAAQARYTVPLNEYGDSYTVNGQEDGHLSVKIDKDFWSDSTHAQIYVLDAVLDWNHPHASAVIIDTEAGKIQFSRYG